jgi:hypothetical protein
MGQVYTAFASEVKVNDETIAGLQSIEYAVQRNRQSVGAVGTDERIAVYFGLKIVTGSITVASVNATLDKLLKSGDKFSISAVLKHGTDSRNVTFDECYCETKSFAMSAESHGSTVYGFSSTRVREEAGA